MTALNAHKAEGLEQRNISQKALDAARWMHVAEATAAEAARRHGLGLATVLRANCVLQHGTPAEIAAVEAGRLRVDPLAKLIWARNPAAEQEHEKPKRAYGKKADVPAGDRAIGLPDDLTPEQAARKGLAIEAEGHGRPMEAAAKALGIAGVSYKRLREIVLLHDRIEELPPKYRSVVKAAFEQMQATRSVSRAYATIAHISAKVWGQGTHRKTDRTEQKRVDHFLNYMESVSQACASAVEIDVPLLPITVAEERIKWIDRAVKDLGKLKRKLEENT